MSFTRRTSPLPVARPRLLRLGLGALLLLLCALLWLAAPAQAQDAANPAPTATPLPLAAEQPFVNKPCSSCHSEEAEAWMESPHATVADPTTGDALATCTTCHGDYTRGHPDQVGASLKVDSSSCQECHAETFAQWQNSIHGDEGVQCISCHLVHSQGMRLTDESLCTSCHREALDDSLHQAHWQSDTTCTDCHMAQTDNAATTALASVGQFVPAANVPTHDFVTVSAAKCLDCHRKDVTAAASSVQTISAAPASVESVSLQLEQAQQQNRSLTVFSLANLGFGIGIGGILGIIFMLAFARFGSRRDQ